MIFPKTKCEDMMTIFSNNMYIITDIGYNDGLKRNVKIILKKNVFSLDLNTIIINVWFTQYYF